MTASPDHTTAPAPPATQRLRAAVVPLSFVAVVLIGVGAVSTYALITLLLDAMATVLLLLPPVLTGMALVPQHYLAALPRYWRVLIGAGIGIGLLCIAVLILGCAGLLSRPLWIVLLSVMFLFGVVRLRMQPTEPEATRTPRDPMRWLWLLLMPMLILGVLCAVHAPGYLWSEEGFGYDALEYHLELPKSYRANGQIDYQPQNVYANFPSNVEMLYLLGMVVLDRDIEFGTTSHMIHLALGMLTVLGAYVGGREWSPRAGIVSAVTMGSVGWLVYLSGLAYVEHGLLFFGMTATAAMLRAFSALRGGETGDAPPVSTSIGLRWCGLAGLLAGFACGCKYTGLPMVALPIVLAPLLSRVRLIDRLRGVTITAVGAAVAFAPWAIKNIAMTGNPVFPLANTYFQAEPSGWGMEESARWDRSHSASADRNGDPSSLDHSGESRLGLSHRIKQLWTHVLADKYGRFGPLVFGLAVTGFLIRRNDRRQWLLVGMILVQLMVWLLATHLYARFAVVLLIPTALLGGRSALVTKTRTGALALAGVLVTGVGLNLFSTLRLYRSEAMPGAIAPASWIYEGQLPGYEHLGVINRELPGDARLLVLGDAKAFYYDRDISYGVVFNRSPFIDVVKQDPNPAPIGRFLRAQQFTHLFVDWSEVRRLRRSSYGFPPEIHEELFSALETAGVIRRVRDSGDTALPDGKWLFEVERE